MKRILHCADLHLSASAGVREYSMSVLEEIVKLGLSKDARYMLLAGDTFDSFDDAEKLRGEFREAMKPLQGKCEVILLAGNHEDIGRGKKKLSSFDLGIEPGNIIEKGGKPWRRLECDGIEFLAVPHQPDYREYMQWAVEDKTAGCRIGIAHGIIAGMSFTGLSDDGEEDASVIDSDLFQRFSVDYAAMGHIHSARKADFNELTICYPGSARVWRKGETGPRTVCLIEAGKVISVTDIELESPGQYRKFDFFLGLDGDIGNTGEVSDVCTGSDYVDISFSGIVDDEQVLSAHIQELEKDLRSRVRVLEIERDSVSVLEGISSQPLARKFLEQWEMKRPVNPDHYSMRVWEKSREVGLMKLKEALEAAQ